MYTVTINIARIVKSKSMLLIFLTVFWGLTACSNDNAENTGPPTPPIQLQFDMQKTGSKIEIDFQIVEKRRYAFYLIFIFKEGDRADFNRVLKLSGVVLVTIKQVNKLFQKGQKVYLLH
jgi:hypothetical protein